MKAFHHVWGMICLWVLGVLINSYTYANTGKFDLNDVIKGEDYANAIVQLDSRLHLLDPSRNVELWTITLLQGARVRALQSDDDVAPNYLETQIWPESPLEKIILRIGVAQEIQEYLNKKSWGLVSQRGDNDVLSERHIRELDKHTLALNKHYRTAFDAAKQNALTLAQASAYLTDSQFPSHIRGQLADLIASRWMEFLIDDLFWSVDQQKQLSRLDVRDFLDLSETANLADVQLHPLQKIKNISADLFAWHNQSGRKEAAFEVIRYYTQLLNKYFSTATDTEVLIRYLTEHLKQLGPQHPWWTMGQYQLAVFRQQMADKNALLDAYDLAVQASIVHPESLGAQRSKQLLRDLGSQEFSVSGQRSSGLGQASLTVNYRNLYRLYFRAWRVSEPLPADLTEAAQRVVVDELLKQPAEVEWVAELTDNADLHYHDVQLVPQIHSHGQWLLLASPQAEFADVPTKLQLLNLHFSHYVASVHYLDGEFNVAVYDGLRGRSMPNITAELLMVSSDDSTEVLEVAKTDVNGLVHLRRNKDAEHYQIRLRHGIDSSVIETPGLLPLIDEKRWASQPAKAVILTNKTVYETTDNILWTMVVKADGAAIKGSPKALKNQSGWIRLYSPDNQLLTEQRIKTDHLGTVSGAFKLTASSGRRELGRYRIESSWAGHKFVEVDDDFAAGIVLDKLATEMLTAQRLTVSGGVIGKSIRSDAASIEWQLRQVSYLPNGDLQLMTDVAKGSAEVIKQRFSIDTSMQLVNDTPLLRHRFELHLDFESQGRSLAAIKQSLYLKTSHEYVSILSDQAFYETGGAVNLKLSRANSQWKGVAGQSQWFLYKLIAPNRKITQSKPEEWLTGALQQNGEVSHGADGIADLPLNRLDVGVYRLRVKDNNDSESAVQSEPSELDFIVVQSEQANRLDQANVLLAQKAVVNVGETLKLLAGSGEEGQWVRLNILKQGEAITSQMLSPGVHLLNFPISESHQGGLRFSLEWVEKNQIYNKDIVVTVPRRSNQLPLVVTQEGLGNAQNTWLLKASTSEGAPLINSGSRVLVAYSEQLGDEEGTELWDDLRGLHPQSSASMIRLDNNGMSYPYYFRGSRQIAKSGIAELRHPDIRYSDKNNDLFLRKDNEFNLLPMMINTDRSVGDVSISPQNAEQLSIDSSSHSRSKGSAGVQYFESGVLDAKGTLTLTIPKALEGKKVRAHILLLGPELETGQLSVTLW